MGWPMIAIAAASALSSWDQSRKQNAKLGQGMKSQEDLNLFNLEQGKAQAERRDRYQKMIDDMIGKYVSGDEDIDTSSMYASTRVPLEQQFAVRKRKLEESGLSGGALQQALSSLEAERASAVGEIEPNLMMQMINLANTNAGGTGGLDSLGQVNYTQGINMAAQGAANAEGNLGQSGQMFGQMLQGYLNQPGQQGQQGQMLKPEQFESFKYQPPANSMSIMGGSK